MPAIVATPETMTGNATSPLRVLLVDDDIASRKEVAGMLATYASHPVVKQCSTGFEALSEIHAFKPDVLICEVELPGIDGFSLLETISLPNRPATIFLSSREHFAAKAFEVSAVDYIVKPIERDRFLKACERVWTQIEARNPAPMASARAKQLVIRSGRSVTFVRPEELDYAEAEGKYVRLHVGKEIFTMKMSMTSLEAELNPAQFVRIHRSTLINIDRVRRVQPWDHRRTYQVTLQDGTRLVVSRKSRLL